MLYRSITAPPAGAYRWMRARTTPALTHGLTQNLESVRLQQRKVRHRWRTASRRFQREAAPYSPYCSDWSADCPGCVIGQPLKACAVKCNSLIISAPEASWAAINIIITLLSGILDSHWSFHVVLFSDNNVIILVIEAGTSFMSLIYHTATLSLVSFLCNCCTVFTVTWKLQYYNRTAVTSVRIVARTTGKNSWFKMLSSWITYPHLYLCQKFDYAVC